MKYRALLLLGFLSLTACPQVGSTLVPRAIGAANPAVESQDSVTEEGEAGDTPSDMGSEDRFSDIPSAVSEVTPPPSDPAPSEPAASDPAASDPPPTPRKASSDSPDVGGEYYVEATAPTPGSDYLAAANPIDPKSDERVIDHEKQLYAGVRLLYGDDFENSLDPEAEDLPDIPRDADGKIHLAAEAQTKWHKHSDWKDSPKGDVVRVVLRPEDDSHKTKYCDARVSIDFSEEEGGNVLFSGLSAGPGRLDFYQLTPVFRKDVKEHENSTSDPISPCESGWQTLDHERHLKTFWDFLGSFNSAPRDGNP